MTVDENGFERIEYTGSYLRPPRNQYGLTDREEVFVETYIENITDEDAAILAYETAHPSVGKRRNRERLGRQAQEFLSRFRIRQRIDELIGGRLADASNTLADHLQRLAAIREAALDANDLKSALRAEQLIGIASRHYVEIAPGDSERDSDAPRTEEELKKSIAERLKRLGMPANVVPMIKKA